MNYVTYLGGKSRTKSKKNLKHVYCDFWCEIHGASQTLEYAGKGISAVGDSCLVLVWRSLCRRLSWMYYFLSWWDIFRVQLAVGYKASFSLRRPFLPVLTQIEILITGWSVSKYFTFLGSAFCILDWRNANNSAVNLSVQLGFYVFLQRCVLNKIAKCFYVCLFKRKKDLIFVDMEIWQSVIFDELKLFSLIVLITFPKHFFKLKRS